MKTPPATPEFARFTSALHEILQVSKPEMQARIEAHKQSGERFSRGASLDPAVSSKLRSAIAKRS